MQPRHGDTDHKLIWLGKTIKNVKDFCVKYWKALLAFALILIGYILGRKNSDPQLDKHDLKEKDKFIKRQLEENSKLHKKHVADRDKLLAEKESKLRLIDKDREDNIENLSNNEKKLDNILKEKYKLKKGE